MHFQKKNGLQTFPTSQFPPYTARQKDVSIYFPLALHNPRLYFFSFSLLFSDIYYVRLFLSSIEFNKFSWLVNATNTVSCGRDESKRWTELIESHPSCLLSFSRNCAQALFHHFPTHVSQTRVRC